MTVQIRRSSARFVDREPGRLTRHAFSFGPHYDPDRLAFGPMVCHDDHLLGAGRGFEPHPHAGLEIVTTVVSGVLEHRDSLGTSASLGAGEVALLSAGAGVHHSELASSDGAARFVQVWLRADDPEAPPRYRRTPVAAQPGAGAVPVDLEVGVAAAAYAVARLGADETVALPAAPRVHAYVASGALLRSSLADPLQEGDAFALTEEPSYDVTAAVPTLLLVWSFG